jgi:VanZ family protein|tara:strand:- start:790 stop:1143 length:354 start_codon:yes stop_codon:yes gene_type:complete
MKIPWTVTLTYIILITILSHQPADDISEVSPNIKNVDKLFHFIEFSILGFLIFGSLSLNSKEFDQILSLSIKIGILFSCLDEYHQSFVDGRDSSLADLIFDILGVFFGTFLHYRFFR